MKSKARIVPKVRLNKVRVYNKVDNDDLGLFAAKEWKSLIDPYTPHDTGRTKESAKITPWHIKYDPVDPNTGRHYAKKIYYSRFTKFKKVNSPYASWNWDQAAVQAGEKAELYRKINAYLRKK